MLVFGAGGSVWESKVCPALMRLKGILLEEGTKLAVWGVERAGRIGGSEVIERWFCIDDPADIRALIAALEQREVDLAIIASPNETHVGLVCFLLGKLPFIVVEKPLAEEVLAADLAVSLSQGSSSTCKGLDHYLAKPASRFVLNKVRSGKLNDLIGEIKEIRFVMTEGRGVEPERVATLRKGLTLDMAIHGFAILLSLLRSSNIKQGQIAHAARARYEGSPIAEETAARIDISIDEGLKAVLMVGKGIRDDKLLVIRGTVGTLEANFATGVVSLERGARKESLVEVTPDDAYEVLLKEAIHAVCSLSSEEENSWLINLPLARDALSLVERSRSRFDVCEIYPIGTVPRILARQLKVGETSVEIYLDRDALERAILREILRAAQAATKQYGNFVLVIPGGRSFLGVSRLLLKEKFKNVDLSCWHVFFSDEHLAPHDNNRNNYSLAYKEGGWKELIEQGRIHSKQIYGIKTEDAESILDYEAWKARVHSYCNAYLSILKERQGADLLILGLGKDQHTASILPRQGKFDNPLLRSECPYDIVEYPKDYLASDRLRASITLTGIIAVRQTIMLAFGESKSKAIHSILSGELDPAAKPGSIIRLVRGTIMTDEAGGSLLYS